MAPQTKKRKTDAIKTQLGRVGDDCMKNIFTYMQNFEPYELMTTCKQFHDGVEQLDELILGVEGIHSEEDEEEMDGEIVDELQEDIRNKLNSWLDSEWCEKIKRIIIRDAVNLKEAKKIFEKCQELTEVSIVVSSGKLTVPSMKNLKKLEIGGGVELQFESEMENLKTLSLKGKSPKSCDEIVKCYPNLEELQLVFKGADLSPLKSLKNLKSLHLVTDSESKMQADQVYESMAISTLETFKLDMNGPYSLCSPFIRNKVKCSHLKTLFLCNRNFLDEDMEELAEDEDIDSFICELIKSEFPKLENLKLQFASVQNLDPLLKNECISNIKSLQLIGISSECFKQICSNSSSLNGLLELECKIDTSIEDEEESRAFQELSKSSFENLKSFKIEYENFEHAEIGFDTFCKSKKFTKLEHLHLGFQIEPKHNLLLPKSDSFPNLKSLYVMFIQGKVPSFLTTLGKNENFSKLQEFTVGMYVSTSDLQKLKKSENMKRLTKVKSLENEDDDE